MYSTLRIFPITGYGADGKPTLGTPIPLLAVGTSEKEINNISIELTPTESTREYKADNRVEQDDVQTGFEGTVTFYGIDKTAIAAISGHRIDSNNHVVLRSNSEGNPKVCIFAQAKGEKGTKYNLWLYNVEFKGLPFSAGQSEDNPTATSLNFFASAIPYGGEDVFGITVDYGTTGYIAEGTEPTAANLVMPEAATN